MEQVKSFRVENIDQMHSDGTKVFFRFRTSDNEEKFMWMPVPMFAKFASVMLANLLEKAPPVPPGTPPQDLFAQPLPARTIGHGTAEDGREGVCCRPGSVPDDICSAQVMCMRMGDQPSISMDWPTSAPRRERIEGFRFGRSADDLRRALGPDQLGPDQVPVVRAQMPAANLGVGGDLDGGALLDRHAASAPIRHNLSRDAETVGETACATAGLGCSLNDGIHAHMVHRVCTESTARFYRL